MSTASWRLGRSLGTLSASTFTSPPVWRQRQEPSASSVHTFSGSARKVHVPVWVRVKGWIHGPVWHACLAGHSSRSTRVMSTCCRCRLASSKPTQHHGFVLRHLDTLLSHYTLPSSLPPSQLICQLLRTSSGFSVAL